MTVKNPLSEAVEAGLFARFPCPSDELQRILARLKANPTLRNRLLEKHAAERQRARKQMKEGTVEMNGVVVGVNRGCTTVGAGRNDAV
jgi:hypothetical protein